MIRYRALPIAAGYPDGNDCDVLKSDAAFKMVVGRLPERDRADRCSQPTISQLENRPGPVALKRMMAAMVELFCDRFEQVPRRILLDIEDPGTRFTAGRSSGCSMPTDPPLGPDPRDSRCFLPTRKAFTRSSISPAFAGVVDPPGGDAADPGFLDHRGVVIIARTVVSIGRFGSDGKLATPASVLSASA
jgi:hypothetical protein